MGRFYERNKAAPIVIHSCHNSKHKYEVQKSPLNTSHNNYQIQINYYVTQINTWFLVIVSGTKQILT